VQNNSSTENHLTPYRRLAYEFTFLHLKLMKKNSFINITDQNLHQQRKKQVEQAHVIDFSNFISKEQEKKVRTILAQILH
jgi:hypothetical protein